MSLGCQPWPYSSVVRALVMKARGPGIDIDSFWAGSNWQPPPLDFPFVSYRSLMRIRQ